MTASSWASTSTLPKNWASAWASRSSGSPTAWDGVILSLDSKKFDCIWNGMTITKERAEKMLFTNPYIMDGQIAVVKADSKVKGFDELGGKVVGVQKGSPALEAAKKLPKAASEVREYDVNPKAFLDLDSGRLTAVVIDNVSGRYFVATTPGKYKVPARLHHQGALRHRLPQGRG